jgi:hypothetical protein
MKFLAYLEWENSRDYGKIFRHLGFWVAFFFFLKKILAQGLFLVLKIFFFNFWCLFLFRCSFFLFCLW